MQTGLNERMVEHTIFFATGDKGEPSQIGKHRSGPIQTIEPHQRAFLWKLVCRQILANSRESFAQFLSISPVPPVSEPPEPLRTVRLRHRCPRPDHFPAFATPVARRADVIQSAKRRRKLISLRQGALPGGFPRPVNVKDGPGVPSSIHQSARLLVGGERTREQIIEKERAQRFSWFLGERR